MDPAPATIEVLPAIADAVAGHLDTGHLDIVLDSGIRHGGDVVIALAQGATAVSIGRRAGTAGPGNPGHHGPGRTPPTSQPSAAPADRSSGHREAPAPATRVFRCRNASRVGESLSAASWNTRRLWRIPEYRRERQNIFESMFVPTVIDRLFHHYCIIM
ncbi:alpha-hydroxy-acid oxidizing protein [Nguyenibacter vanlangensis]|uniref:alpha-hydroxy-acid oxidizing protein n=1 Tax=Nguyenibacter vanlangensis TaxID=1216886 RepID=UPI002483FDBC|nr:alpha-hydroxy-acid oxidizing protein [Nguyenibacter vanlangensis]